MPLRIGEKIAARLLRETPGQAATPVKPLALRRPMWLVIGVAAALLWLVALLLWAQADIDRLILVEKEPLRANEAVAAVFKSISGYGMAFVVFVTLTYLVLAMKSGELKGVHMVYLLIIFSYGIGGIAGDLLKEVFDRPRPFVEYADQITPLSHPPTPSLPSGHATKSVALALPFVIFVTDERWWSRLMRAVVLLAALAVAYARIAMGVHYVSDVLAGIGVAMACLPLAVCGANKIGRRMTREKLDTLVKLWAVILFVLMLYLLKLS